MATPASPASDHDIREDMSLDGEEIADLHEDREHPEELLLERIHNLQSGFSRRMFQMVSLGYYNAEQSAVKSLVTEHVTERQKSRRLHAAQATTGPLAALAGIAGKANRKFSALREKNQTFQRLQTRLEERLRAETPTGGNMFVRLWRRFRGPSAAAKKIQATLVTVQEAKRSVEEKVNQDPRQQMRREFEASDLELRTLLLRHAPGLSPEFDSLIHSLASGSAKPLEAALVRQHVGDAERRQILAVANRLRGEYSGPFWRALGALGTVFTLGKHKGVRAVAAGAKNTRSAELAAFYIEKDEERNLYEHLSIPAQMRGLPSLSPGTILTVDGQRMIFEKMQEQRGRRSARLLSLDRPGEAFLLDVTNPDRPIFRRAVPGSVETEYRTTRIATSRLPAFVPLAPRRPRTSPVEATVTGFVEAVRGGGAPAIEAALRALNTQLETELLGASDDVATERRTRLIDDVNTRLTAQGLATRVQFAADRIAIVPPPRVVPERERRRIELENRVPDSLTALTTAARTDVAGRTAAMTAALAPFQELIGLFDRPDDAVALAARMHSALIDALGEPLPVDIRLDGTTLTIVTPSPATPVLPERERRRAELEGRLPELVNGLISAAQESDAVRIAAVTAALVPLQELVELYDRPDQVATLVTRLHTSLVTTLGDPLPVEIVLNAGRLQTIFTATAAPDPVRLEEQARETMANHLQAELAGLRELAAEHRRDENKASGPWWDANRSRYVRFRAETIRVLDEEMRRSTDIAYRQVLAILTRDVEETIQASGDFPGGHPAIDALAQNIESVVRSFQPAPGVS